MRYELSARLLAFLAEGSNSAPPDNTLKVALVTGAALVIAAAITAFAATFQRSKPTPVLLTPPDDEDLETELRRRAETAEGLVVTLNHRVAQLERYLYRAQIDPETGGQL